jgi:hypothetical protein
MARFTQTNRRVVKAGAAFAVAALAGLGGGGFIVPTQAAPCPGGGFAVSNICCSYNIYGGNFVATQNGGFIGYCNGGVRTPPQYNIGRGPGD